MFSYHPGLFIPEKVIASWSKDVALYVLRTDTLHPVVSGNKWFKLKYYVQDALDKGYRKMATFGGCFSNHIVATAFATQQAGLQATGIIRGEEHSLLNSHTLQQAKEYGMNFYFTSRETFKNKDELKETFSDCYIVNEGGYGVLGAKGASEMLTNIPDYGSFDYIMMATGTGTTMAGIINAASIHQNVIGISVMKNNYSLEREMTSLLTGISLQKKFKLLHDYHFGGYAKNSDELISFMNGFYTETGIPTDFVYTGKAVFALKELIDNDIIPKYSKILFIHTGGLQGNCTLPKDKLIYQ